MIDNCTRYIQDCYDQPCSCPVCGGWIKWDDIIINDDATRKAVALDDIQKATATHHPDYNYPQIIVSCCVVCHVFLNKQRTKQDARKEQP